ncbi:MAG: hypothetical protein NVV77_17875 [Devosia sp.]|nr:hypothetical protein [Devosia sp.]MCR6636673.1 hypothetical protein [Devosia sp.]
MYGANGPEDDVMRADELGGVHDTIEAGKRGSQKGRLTVSAGPFRPEPVFTRQRGAAGKTLGEIVVVVGQEIDAEDTISEQLAWHPARLMKADEQSRQWRIGRDRG